MRERVAVNSRCPTVGSSQYFQTWKILVLIFFVSFNINDWKESVESLNNSLIWEDTELYLLLSTHREWESFFVTSCKCCQQWLRLRWVLFICSTLFLATTVFGNSCFPFFLHKLTFISRQNGLGRKSRVHKTVTVSLFFSIVVNKNIASSVW